MTATMLISRDLAGSKTDEVYVHMHCDFIVIGPPLLYFEINFTIFQMIQLVRRWVQLVSVLYLLKNQAALVKELKLSLWSHQL